MIMPDAPLPEHPLDQVDPTFADDLPRAKCAEILVAYWLQAQGYGIHLHRWAKRPTPDKRYAYKDGGDIYVLGPKAPRDDAPDWKRWEVKYHDPNHAQAPEKYQWTCEQDCQFPDFKLDKESTWREAVPPIEAYVKVNAPMTHAAIFLTRTARTWTRRPFGRSGSTHQDMCLFGPIEQAEFREIRTPYRMIFVPWGSKGAIWAPGNYQEPKQ